MNKTFLVYIEWIYKTTNAYFQENIGYIEF